MKKTILKRSVAILLSFAMLLAYAPGLAYLGIESSKTQAYAATPTSVGVTYHYNNTDSEKQSSVAAEWDVVSSTITYTLKEALETPTRDGYVFDGWYFDANCARKITTTFTENDLVSNRLNLYAGWREVSKITHEVTFYSARSANYAEQNYSDYLYARESVEEGKSATAPKADPAMEGYKFKGWSDTQGGVIVDPSDYKVMTDLAFYAVYEKQVEVKFDAYGYQKDGSSYIDLKEDQLGYQQVDTQHVDKNAQAKNPGELTAVGYEFLGWFEYTKDGIDNKPFDFGKKLTDDTLIKAVWQKKADVKITYDLNGEGNFYERGVKQTYETVEATVPYNTVMPKIKEGEAREDGVWVGDKFYRILSDTMNFEGWYYDEECKYEFNFNNPVTETTRVYAKWVPKTYEVSFDAYGYLRKEDGTIQTSPKLDIDDLGYLEIATQTVNATEKAQKPENPAVKGYVFIGWYDERFVNGQFDFGTKIVKDTKLVAVWEEADFDVTFNGNGKAIKTSGEKVYSVGVQEGQMVGEPTLEEIWNHGYTFGGWYTDKNCTDGNEFDFASTPITKNVTLWAKWTANEYTVKYDKNSIQAKGSMDDETFVYDEKQKIAENQFTRFGYKFMGWSTDADDEQAIINTTSKYNAEDLLLTITNLSKRGQCVENKEITLYAIWAPNKYLVTYDGNGATVDNYLDGDNVNMGEQDPTPKEQVVHYTDGEGNDYTTLFPVQFEKTGYQFVGWNTKADGTGTAYEDEQVLEKTWIQNFVKKDTNLTDVDEGRVTLYAQWKALKYPVIFDANDGTETPATTVQEMTYDQAAILNPNTFSRPGYYFKGWSQTRTGEVAYNDKAQVINLATGDWCVCTGQHDETKGVVLYAIWAEADTQLLAKATPVGKKAYVTWTNAKGATSYAVYGAKCGKSMQYIGTVSGNSILVSKIGKAKLRRGSKYKFYVVANTGATSVLCHTIIGNKAGKYGNVTSISAATQLNLGKGQVVNVGASQKLYKKTKKCLGTNHDSKFRFKTSDASVATVDAYGNVHAVGAGTCYVYSQAINGMWTVTKVEVSGTYTMVADEHKD